MKVIVNSGKVYAATLENAWKNEIKDYVRKQLNSRSQLRKDFEIQVILAEEYETLVQEGITFFKISTPEYMAGTLEEITSLEFIKGLVNDLLKGEVETFSKELSSGRSGILYILQEPTLYINEETKSVVLYESLGVKLEEIGGS